MVFSLNGVRYETVVAPDSNKMIPVWSFGSRLSIRISAAFFADSNLVGG